MFKSKVKTSEIINNANMSVVMASYLGEYEGAAKNRINKFHRAVDSFISQPYQHKELIIVSDGCEVTEKIVEENYLSNKQVELIKLPKQELFSGNVRDAGLRAASGDIICYLDTDDYFGNSHLSMIASNLGERDWVYYNDVIRFSNNKFVTKDVRLELGAIGTSSIAHRNLSDISWKGCDGYNHDWTLVQKLIKDHPSHGKIFGCAYYICHVPNQVDS
jgi:glycosyltransferase involved in cell wall biosynthesis